jgi:flagellar motor switch/type III secretory pathway protein FliN
MIVALAFGSGRRYDGRIVREARFVERSTVPVSALCLVANGVREHLRRLLGVNAEVTFGEPAPLSESARVRLFAQTDCFLTRGRTADVFLFVRRDDARRLLEVALGASAPGGDLSPLERSALTRLAHELAALFDPLCAERHTAAQIVGIEEAAHCRTYVDLRLGPPLDALLGVGLTREPSGGVGVPTISARHILAVPCEVRAEIARGTISAAELAALESGRTVRMDTKVADAALLKAGEVVIGHGRGGVVVADRTGSATAAFAVDSVIGPRESSS